MATIKQLRQWVDRLFLRARERGLRRVKDSTKIVEHNAKGKVCRVCAYGLIALCSRRSRVRNMIRDLVVYELGHRGDNLARLRTVPDMRAMRKLFDDAVRREELRRR